MPRLFVAIDLPDEHTEQLRQLRDDAINARWTPPEQYHLTLRFIGDVEDDRVDPIREALSAIQTPPFVLQGQGLGVFPSRRRPRVVFANIDEVTTLMNVQRDIEQTLQELGFEEDAKAFRPHVTLARLKRAPPQDVRAYLQAHQEFTLDPFDVRAYYLYESTLHPSGAVHERIATFALGND